MTLSRGYALLVMGPAALVLGVMFFAPLAYFLRFAFSEETSGQGAAGFTISNFVAILSDGYEVRIILESLVIAASATLAAFLISIPISLLMRASAPRAKAALIILCIFPLVTGSVVRTIGWQAIFGYSGVLNSMMLQLGVIDTPLELFRNPTMVAVVIVSIVASFMVLLMHSSLEQVDRNTELAAQALGAGPIRTFLQVTLPQITPAIIAGTSLVFVISVNAYATPLLIGAGQVPMVATRVYDIVATQGDFARGAAFAAVSVVLFVTLIVVYSWSLRRQFTRWKAVSA